MKKILSLSILMITFWGSSKAQDTVYVTPVILSPAVTFSNCKLGDSTIIQYCFINRGPDTIKAHDTIGVNNFFNNSSNSLSLAITPKDILPGDTFLQRSRYFRRTDINWMLDSTGNIITPNFPNGTYTGIVSWYGIVTKLGAYTYGKKKSIVTNTANTTGFSSIAKLPVTIKCPLPPTKISDALLNKEPLHIFPNPATDQISINSSFQKATTANYRITDIAGRVVKSMDLGKQNAGEKIFTVDITQLSKGMYYIELVTEESKSINKFSKN